VPSLWQNAGVHTDNGFPHPSQRHELAHVIFLRHWGTVLGIAWSRSIWGRWVRCRSGIIEALPCLPMGFEDENLHRRAPSEEMGDSYPPRPLFTAFTVSRRAAYTRRVFFLRYIYETQLEPLRRCIASDPLHNCRFFRLSESELAFLPTVRVPEYSWPCASVFCGPRFTGSAACTPCPLTTRPPMRGRRRRFLRHEGAASGAPHGSGQWRRGCSHWQLFAA
jgi:hypothetical protein